MMAHRIGIDGVHALASARLPALGTSLRYGCLLACASLCNPVCAQSEKDIDGELSLHGTFSKSTYTSKRLAFDGSFLTTQVDGELGGELQVDREYVRVPGQASSISADRHDANIKKKFFLASHDYYAYVSPRYRHDRYGYFERSLALRIGAGRRYTFDHDALLSLDLGTGYRKARILGGEWVTESLISSSASFDWKCNDSTRLKFALTHEQGAIESYRTVELSLRNKLASNFGVKFRLTYTRDYPFSSLEHSGEVVGDVGLSYSF